MEQLKSKEVVQVASNAMMEEFQLTELESRLEMVAVSMAQVYSCECLGRDPMECDPDK